MLYQLTVIFLVNCTPGELSLHTNKSLNNRHQLLPPGIPHPGRLLGGNNLRQPSLHIHLLAAPRPRVAPEDQPVTEIQHQEGGNANVRGEEVTRGPLGGEEHGEPVDQREEDGAHQTDRHAIGLHLGDIRLLDALDLAGLVEAEVHDAAADPGDEAGGVGEVDEPVEDGVGAVADGQVGQEREEGGDADGHVGDAPAVAGLEDAGGVAGDGEGVERAGGHVQERIAGGPGRGEDGGVDDAVEHGDAGVVDGHDPGRGGGVAVAGDDLLGLGGADDADGEGAEDVEEDQSVDVAAGGGGDVAAGGLHLAAGDDDQFRGEDEGDGALDDALQQADEAAGGAVRQILVHGARVLPVVEAQALAVGAAAPEEDEGEEEQADQRDDLDPGEPELGLAVGFDGHEVEQHNDDQHDGDPDGDVHAGVPVIDDHGRGDNLVRHQDPQRIPVEIAHGETHAARHIAKPVVTHGASMDRQIRANLGHPRHQRIHQRGNKDVPEQQRQRTTDGERLSRPDKQTRPDGATQCHQLHMTVFQSSLGDLVSFVQEIALDQGLDGAMFDVGLGVVVRGRSASGFFFRHFI